jgi:hypothetical protein
LSETFTRPWAVHHRHHRHYHQAREPSPIDS